MTNFDIKSIIIFLLKIIVPVFILFYLIKLYRRSASEKPHFKYLTIQMIISAIAGFFIFFVAAWLFLKKIFAYSVPEDFMIYIRAGIVGCLLGAFIGLFIGERRFYRIQKKKTNT